MKDLNKNDLVVSVCMITYNHQEFISEAIDSILNQQTDFWIEIVIGIDVCSDNTLKICEKYEKKYPHLIRLLIEEKRLGMMKNFVRSIKACNGQYIAFCEGDDFWIDEFKLQKQVDLLEQNETYVICATDFNTYKDKSLHRYNSSSFAKGKKSIEDIFIHNQFATATVCIRAKILKYIDLTKLADYKYGDRPLWIMMLQYGSGYLMSDTTAVYREHLGGAYSQKLENTKILESIHLIKQLHEDLRITPSNRVILYYKKLFWNILMGEKSVENRTKISNLILPFLSIGTLKSFLFKILIKTNRSIFSRIGWRLLNI